MSAVPRQYVFLGLSITSTWGNGHATTYRALLKHLSARGHSVTFLERDVPWYRDNREFTSLPYCEIGLYAGLDDLRDRFTKNLANADAIVVGSYVPDGQAVGRWARSIGKHLVAFYDIDTPVTLSALAADRCEYLARDMVRKYDLYLSFTGGPTLGYIQETLGSPCARPLYCSVDANLYFPEVRAPEWELGYLGTYASDRQPALQALLMDVASQMPHERFAVAGPQYPADIGWPRNVTRIEHLPAAGHRAFYNSQRFALNITRRDMVRAGYSPSVRLFEAAACGTPILTDDWAGMTEFFQPGLEITPVRTTSDVRRAMLMGEEQRKAIADRARRRVLRFHSAAVRALEFEQHVDESLNRVAPSKQWRAAAQSCEQTPALLGK